MSALKPRQSASRIHTLNNFPIIYTSLLQKYFLHVFLNLILYTDCLQNYRKPKPKAGKISNPE